MVPGVVIPNYRHDYSSGGNILGRLKHVESDTSDYSIQFYYDHVQFRDPFVDYAQDTLDLEFQHRFELARGHELIYGFGARVQHDNLGSFFLPAPMVTPDSRTTYLLSGFVQDTIQIVPDRMHLILGSKLEYNSFTGAEIQPSGRLLWTPDAKNSVWAAVSRAVRTPSRWHENADFLVPIPVATPTFLHITGGRSDLKSEDLIAYELGYRSQLARNLSVDLTGFVNIYDRLISLREFPAQAAPFGVLLPRQWDNGQSAETYGTEVAVNWKVNDDWRLAASYSLLLAYVHNDDASFRPQLDSAVEDSAPRNMFQLHSYLNLTRNLEFNTSLYYVQGIGPGGIVVPAPPPGVGSYVRVDANVTWHPKPGLDLSIGVENPFDPQHMEAASGMGANGEVERAVYTQLTWRF